MIPNFRRWLPMAGVAMLVSGILPGTLSSVLLAQKKTREERREEANSRSVQGVVTGADDKAALGAIVMLKDLKTLQVRSFITQTDGTYHFSGLKADVDYELTAKSGDLSSGPRR